MHDLSLTGSKVSAPPDVRPGQDCVLTWDGNEAFGRIIWIRAGMCGVAFERPIPPSLLIATRDRNDADALPEEFDLRRESARRFAQGVSRF